MRNCSRRSAFSSLDVSFFFPFARAQCVERCDRNDGIRNAVNERNHKVSLKISVLALKNDSIQPVLAAIELIYCVFFFLFLTNQQQADRAWR